MAAISTWSKTAADNNSSPPNGAPEGWAPSAVNNVIRENMAQVRTWYEDSEWTNYGDTPTQISTTKFSVPEDQTSNYLVNRRVKFFDGSTLYGVITESSLSTSVTNVTVSLDGGGLTASLTSMALSVLKPTSSAIPLGGVGAAEISSGAISDLADTVIAAGDYVMFGDTTDSNNLKKDTVQGILDLVATSAAYDMPFNAGFDAAGVKGNVAVQSYGFMVAGRSGTFSSESGYAETAPTDADLIIDITKNGTSIYSTPPEFAATSQTLTAGTIKSDGTEDFVKGDRIVFKITQIGSTLPGQGIQFTCVVEV